jgi:MraZ protein
MSLFLNTALFLSTHVNRIDGKGRVSFPASFRSALAARNSQGVVIFRSPSDQAIEGVTIERMQQMSAALEALSPYAPERAYFETAIFGTAQELQVDREGRCSLPRGLLDQVGIGLEVAFLGRGPTFQIWEPEALTRRTAESAEALKSGAVAFPTLPAGVM